MTNRTRVLLIILVAFLAYANCLLNDLVGDDLALFGLSNYYHEIKDLPRIFQPDFLLTYKDVDLASSAGMTGFSGFVSYRPVVAATFFLDHFFWGANPVGLHFSNLLLHFLACVLLFFFVRRLTGIAGVAFWSALFFATHPVHAELVNTIGYRSDLLVTVFALLSLIAYDEIRRSVSQRKMFIWSAAAILSYVLAVFSKESGVAIPFLVVLYELCFSRGAAAREEGAAAVELKKARIATVAGYFAVLAFYLYIYLAVFPNSNRGVLYDQGPDTLSHLALMAKLLAVYLTAFIFPASVHVLPPLYAPSIGHFSLLEFLVLAVLAGTTLGAIRAWQKGMRLYSFLIGWFWLTYLPVSGLLMLPNPLAYRFLYLPSIAFFVVLAFGTERFGRAVDRSMGSQKLGVFLKGSLVAFFLAVTVPLNFFFHDTFSSCREMIRNYPDAQRPYFHLGLIYLAAGDLSAAQESLGTYLQTESRNPFVKAMDQDYYVHYHLGVALAGDPNHAIPHFKEAIRERPDFLPAYENLAHAYFMLQDPATALYVAQHLLLVEPNSVNGLILASEAERQLGHRPEAEQYFKQVSAVAPDDPGVRALSQRLESNP